MYSVYVYYSVYMYTRASQALPSYNRSYLSQNFISNLPMEKTLGFLNF